MYKFIHIHVKQIKHSDDKKWKSLSIKNRDKLLKGNVSFHNSSNKR